MSDNETVEAVAKAATAADFDGPIDTPTARSRFVGGCAP
jgi:hypothetical protein